MRGVFCSILGCLGVVACSVLVLFSGDLVFFWLFLELGGLFLIPCFFLYDNNCLGSLFSYIIASSVASSFILFGLISFDLTVFMFVGFIIKFGIFPLFGWVYDVVTKSNWLVVMCLSTFLKTPFVYVCFFLGGSYNLVGCLLCSVSFLMLAIFFWLNTLNWFYCWCHMMLSSSASLILMSLFISLDILWWLFVVYLVWSLVGVTLLWYFAVDGNFEIGGGQNGLYIFSLSVVFLTTPLSLALFYKLVICFSIFSCGLLPVCCWVIYGVSEQVYLFKYLVSFFVPKGNVGILSVV